MIEQVLRCLVAVVWHHLKHSERHNDIEKSVNTSSDRPTWQWQQVQQCALLIETNVERRVTGSRCQKTCLHALWLCEMLLFRSLCWEFLWVFYFSWLCFTGCLSRQAGRLVSSYHRSLALYELARVADGLCMCLHSTGDVCKAISSEKLK